MPTATPVFLGGPAPLVSWGFKHDEGMLPAKWLNPNESTSLGDGTEFLAIIRCASSLTLRWASSMGENFTCPRATLVLCSSSTLGIVQCREVLCAGKVRRRVQGSDSQDVNPPDLSEDGPSPHSLWQPQVWKVRGMLSRCPQGDEISKDNEQRQAMHVTLIITSIYGALPLRKAFC